MACSPAERWGGQTDLAGRFLHQTLVRLADVSLLTFQVLLGHAGTLWHGQGEQLVLHNRLQRAVVGSL